MTLSYPHQRFVGQVDNLRRIVNPPADACTKPLNRRYTPIPYSFSVNVTNVTRPCKCPDWLRPNPGECRGHTRFRRAMLQKSSDGLISSRPLDSPRTPL